MTTDAVLRSFAAFLTASWGEMSQLLGHADHCDGLVGDWMQANWEILVEPALLPGNSGFLEVYGDGADCNGASSRVFRPEARPTHRIDYLPIPGKRLRDLGTGDLVHSTDTNLWGFVHWDGSTYDIRPEFNAVIFEGGENVILDLTEIEFHLEKI